jgi:hypothetical protein
MKRLYPSGGIPRRPRAVMRLDPTQPPAAIPRANSAAAVFGEPYDAKSAMGDERNAHGDSFKHSRSTRDTGRA